MARWFRFALPLIVAALALPCASALADSSPPSSATVTMSETGFTPAVVAVTPFGSVTWVNKGTNVHTATSIGGSTLPFDTAGIGPGQSATLAFGTPGTYYYSSQPDCLNGNYSIKFPCATTFAVVVTNSNAQAAAVAASIGGPTPTPSPTPNPAASGPVTNATVILDDQGISPATVNVFQGGTVTFINRGLNLHAAQSPGTTTWHGFDTGGLPPGQGSTVTMDQAGTFPYTSPTDCVTNRTPSFNCGPYQVVVVPVAGAQPTPTAAALPALAAPNPNPVVTIDDSTGFSPKTITIKVGQAVTWNNKGTQVHSVTSDPGLIPSFDSGGIGAGQSFTAVFPKPGSFTYHSVPDAVYVSSPACFCGLPTYPVFSGTVDVAP